MLFRLLKNASKWVYKQLLKTGEYMADVEEKFYFGDKNESK
jgi:hypothetical protein